MVNGPQPQWFYNIFKSEDASKHKSEDGGEDPRCGNDPSQRGLLEMIDQRSRNDKEQPLPHIPEHGSEDKGIGDPHKHGGIHLAVGRKSVHPHKHFKRFEKLRIFQLGWGLSKIAVMVVFHHDEDLVIVL